MTLTAPQVPDLTQEIPNLARFVAEGYVDPALGKRMGQTLETNLRKGAYAKLTGQALADRLTDDLHSVYHDRHLRVFFSPTPIPPDPPFVLKASPQQIEGIRVQFGPENYGLTRAEVLRGNVGYLNFRAFLPLELARDTYAAGMRMVANADALIFDLRECGGSMDPAAIPFVMGYLFDKPTHLSDIDWKHDGKTVSYYTDAEVPGPKFLRKPVYVLTSRRTFSGGEGMAYDLQALRRATIVGGQTGGGANPGGTRRATEHFGVWLPLGRVRNAVTGGNWEGVGVTPDIKTNPVQALPEAHLRAVRELRKRVTDPAGRDRLADAERHLLTEALPLKKVRFTLKGFPKAKAISVAGTFNDFMPDANLLIRKGDRWVGEAMARPGSHRYKFVVDGQWMADPKNSRRTGGFGDSVLIVD
ncbi:MAG: S41 family peptidase [Fimbriimonas sp.]